jgi:hypothetical protein
MARLYQRDSSYCEPEDIEPGTREAIAAHAEACSLGDVLANAVACCLTVSTRLYKRVCVPAGKAWQIRTRSIEPSHCSHLTGSSWR